MKRKTYGFAFVLSLLIGVAPQSSVSSDTRGHQGVLAVAATPDVHPAFLVSETQLREAFDAAELRGEKKQGINPGEI